MHIENVVGSLRQRRREKLRPEPLVRDSTRRAWRRQVALGTLFPSRGLWQRRVGLSGSQTPPMP